MTALHVHFTLRNQQAFQRLLDASRNTNAQTASGPALSTSGGRSWNKPSPISGGIPVAACDVNARDRLGRTVLHLAVSSLDPAALEFVKLLLSHPRIDINLTDLESRWTPLHRALYAGNIPASVLLLQRPEIDMSLKDQEGYTAFDVYNSTVEGTKPSELEATDLYTWGTNRNAALGVGDGDDRAFPELVHIPTQNEDVDCSEIPLQDRFQPIRAERVAMSRLHTAVVTSEPRSNLRICGFGSGGRLGAGIGQHTLYAFSVPKELNSEGQITAVALGQDHTLALTKAGNVLSWGLNRFSQLGYALDGGQTLQAAPRRIVGPLKKETIVGIAACRTASACWTKEELFTWGTNGGQLGYDRAGAAVQTLPRRVTQATLPVIDVALSDTAMTVLLASRDVHCFHSGRSFKINFPTQSFPSEIQVYRPPMAQHNASIAKIVSCDNTFAALSLNGEVFTFTITAPPSAVSSDPNASPAKNNIAAPIKPQRVWALRKQISAVKDVALGSDGTILLCTESGHVYLRSRTNKTSKFSRVPLIQRAVSVAASSAGAFAAVKAECQPHPISIEGNSVAEDFSMIQPYLPPTEEEMWDRAQLASMDTVPPQSSSDKSESQRSSVDEVDMDAEDNPGDAAIMKDIALITRLMGLLVRDRLIRKANGAGSFCDGGFRHGADLLIDVASVFEFPVHRVIIASRSPVLKEVLLGNTAEDKDGGIRCKLVRKPSESISPVILFSGVHPLSTVMLIVYLYTDEIPAIWDRRILSSISNMLDDCEPRTTSGNIRTELQKLAALLALPNLADVLNVPVKRSPVPRLSFDMKTLLDSMVQGMTWTSGSPHQHPLIPDMLLNLADAQIRCHSTILRARSPFFAGFFGDPDWTAKRRHPNRTLTINLSHRRLRVMDFVLQFIYAGGNEELFEALDFAQTPDDILEFLFDVVDAAGELLLDRLVLISSSIILRFLNINNACSILSDASHFNMNQLVASIHGYLARNLETFLESRMLDDLPMNLIRQFAEFVRVRQAQKLPVTRSGNMVERALEIWKDWLELQDIPQPIISGRKTSHKQIHQSPKLSPQAISAATRRNQHISSGQLSASYSPPQDLRIPTTPPSAPVQETTETGPDDIFVIDDIPPLNIPSSQEYVPAITPKGVPPGLEKYSPWKARVSQLPSSKLDLRAIMAEAEDQRRDAGPSTIPPARSRVVGFDASPTGATLRASQKIGVSQGDPVAKAGPNSPWRLPKPDPSVGHISAVSNTPLPQKPSGMQHRTVPSGLTRDLRENQVVEGRAHASLASTSSAPQLGQVTSAKGKAPLGPTFTPIRQSVASVSAVPMGRRVSDGTAKVWNSMLTPPAVQSVHTESAGTPGSPTSFLAIQQQQRDQNAGPPRIKKSLLEIQAEEQERAEEERALQEEIEFLRWWAAEEERIRRETQAQPGPPISGPGVGQKVGKKAKKGAGGGKKLGQVNKKLASASSPNEKEAGNDDKARGTVPGGQKPGRRKPARRKVSAPNADR